MADLHSILSSRLSNLQRVNDSAGGWTAQCPICAAAGKGLRARNQLRIWPNGAFNCIIDSENDENHNRLIRQFIYANADAATLASLTVEITDPEPKLTVDKVYPESLLSKLVPDYRYWVGRGISEEVLRKMEGGIAPSEERNKLSGRYCFPIRDEKRRIVGWTARLVNEAQLGPSWKHMCKASRVIFPIHVSGDAIRASRKVILTESPGDALSVMTAGMWNCLILLGLNLNARVLGFLASVNPTRIIISTNNDAIGKASSDSAGNKAATKLREKLIPFFGEERVIIRLPGTWKDWNLVLQKNPEELEAFKKEVEAL